MIFIIIALLMIGICLSIYRNLTIKGVGGIFILLAILCADVKDITSHFCLLKHINIDNYIEIVSAIIGGVIAFYIAKYQIEKTNEENKKNEKESLRIQNLPILKYEIDTEHKSKEDLGEQIFIIIKDNDTGIYNLNLEINNIGNTTIRNINTYIYSDEICNKYQNLIDNNSKNPMKSGDILNINRFMELNMNRLYKFKYIIYYQDILLNWYKQVINVDYRTSTKENGNYKGYIIYTAEEEILINDDIMNNEIKKMMKENNDK